MVQYQLRHIRQALGGFGQWDHSTATKYFSLPAGEIQDSHRLVLIYTKNERTGYCRLTLGAVLCFQQGCEIDE